MTDHAHNFKNLLGKRFGRWLVIGRSTRKSLDGRGRTTMGTNKVRAARWACQCDCGTIREVPGEKMRQGKSKSCGCINTHDLTGKKHGTWEVLRLVRDTKNSLAWLCRCEKTGIHALFSRAVLTAKTPPPCFDDLPEPERPAKEGCCGTWKKVCDAVAVHMKLADAPKMKKSKVRRILGHPEIMLHLALHRLDCMRSSGNGESFEFLVDAKAEYLVEPAVPPPLLRGRDLIERGFKPGPEIGVILREAEELQLEDKLEDRKRALEWLDEKIGD